MTLKHLSGNLLDLADDGEFDIIVHGANCFCVMGGGIAREIRERYPAAWAADAVTTTGDYTKLGNWTVGLNDLTDRKFLILNAYTQYNVSQGNDVFEYVAFELILQKLIHVYGTKRIGLPYIGTGLAGGNKELILAAIEWFAFKVSQQGGSVTLVSYNQPVAS